MLLDTDIFSLLAHNQNYNKILELDWLKAARLIGQCTHHACNWTVRVILRALLRCTFLSKLSFSAFITTFEKSSAESIVRFSNFVIVLIKLVTGHRVVQFSL